MILLLSKTILVTGGLIILISPNLRSSMASLGHVTYQDPPDPAGLLPMLGSGLGWVTYFGHWDGSKPDNEWRPGSTCATATSMRTCLDKPAGG